MITQDDIVYMIVTDRFADGDPDNNQLVNRSDPEGRHGGDLLGIVQRMPYLKSLGVTAIWITPVYPNPADGYHGYFPLDFQSVDPALCSPQLGASGAREVVRRFIDIAHGNDLKVVLDVVVGHTARNHPWLKERPGWFTHQWWLWGLPGFDFSHPDVTAYFTRNALEWMVMSGPDGVRIDAARHVGTDFWKVFKLFTEGLVPDCTMIGEVWDGDPAVVAPYQTEHGFGSMLDFPLQSAIVDVFTKDAHFGRLARPELSEREPAGTLNQDLAYRNAYQLTTFIDNHDMPRFFRMAGGDRDPVPALARMKLALTFLLTTRGIPILYYGTELALDGGPDPDNRRDMPWELIDAPEESDAGRRASEMLAFVKRLIAMRRQSMALRYGLLVTLYVTRSFYAFMRAFLDDVRVVAINNSDEPARVTVPIFANPRTEALIQGKLAEGVELVNALDAADRVAISSGAIQAALAPRSTAVYRTVRAPDSEVAAGLVWQARHETPR